MPGEMKLTVKSFVKDFDEPHDFMKSLAKSHAADKLPIWEEMYRSFFDGFHTMCNHRQDGEHQRAGIDRSVILKNSTQVLIDEKCRFRNEKTGRVYDDIALEYVSNTRTNAPGWVCKPLRCDYIAYAIAPLGVGYMLPVRELQNMWRGWGDLILSKPDSYRQISAANKGYNTLSVCVPPKILVKAIGMACVVKFQRVEVEKQKTA